MLAAGYPLIEQSTIRHRYQLTFLGEQQGFHRTDFLDLPFDIANLDLLPHLIELTHIDAGEDLPGDFATAKPQRQRRRQADGNQHDGNDVVQQVGLHLQLADGHGDADDDDQALGDTAQPMGVRILPLEVKGPNQIPGAFGAMSKERAEALIITNNSRNFVGRRQLIELAAKNRLPTMCGRAAFVEAGALMSYAASRSDSFRRAAYFVDKILKGAKPADLPIEQPTKFEFVINLKTAKQIGFTIPPNVLARADKVIR